MFNASASTYPTHGVWIEKEDGNAAIKLKARTSGAFTDVVTIGTLTAAAWIYPTFQVVMDPVVAGKGVLTAYVNGTQVASWTSTTLPNAEALAPVCAFQSGEEAAMTCDWDCYYLEATR